MTTNVIQNGPVTISVVIDPGTAAGSALASANAAAASATSASGSASSAATNAGTATTQATASAASAAAALVSKNAAAASATAAGASQTAAAGSATTASNAAVSLTASLASFNKLWLGPHSSDPTVDNQGNALQIGAQYQNTAVTPNIIRIYTASGWQDQDAEAEQAGQAAQLSATQAASSAGAAASSATQASNSATAASNSASAASTSATNAANSANTVSSTIAAMVGELSLALTNANVTLSTTQAQNGIYKLTGALTANVTVTIPTGTSSHNFTVQNLCTGQFTVTFVLNGQTPSVIVPTGYTWYLFSDSTGVYVVYGDKVSAITMGKTYAVQGANLLVNGSGELGTYGWVSGNGFALTAVVREGGPDIEVAPYGTVVTGSINSAPFPVLGGFPYVIQGELLIALTAGSVFLDIQYLNSAGADVLDGANSLPAFTNQSGWLPTIGYDVAIVPPSTAVTAYARLVFQSASWTSMRFRRVKVEQGSLPSTYSTEASDTYANGLALAALPAIKAGSLGKSLAVNTAGVVLTVANRNQTIRNNGTVALTTVVPAAATMSADSVLAYDCLRFIHDGVGPWTITTSAANTTDTFQLPGSTATSLTLYPGDTMTLSFAGGTGEIDVIDGAPLEASRSMSVGALTTNNVFGALGNRNQVVDGNCDVWNATTAALSTTGAYTPLVMRFGSCGAGGVGTANQVAFNGTEPAGCATPALFFYRHIQTTASTGTVAAGTAPYISTRIERIRTLNGRSATYSIWLRVASSTLTLSNVLLTQSPGSGGSPSAQVSINTAVTWVLTTTWQKFSVRVDLPSTSGLTLGTNNNDCLNLGLWLPPGATYTVDMFQDQLEACPVNAPAAGLPTPFDNRGIALEQVRVQRFYETGNLYMLGSTVGQASSQSAATGPVAYKVTKRASPAVSFNVSSSSNVSSLALAFGVSPADQFTPNAIVQTPGGYNLASAWTADARI